MKQVLLLISIVLLFFTVNTEAQLKPAQSQYLVEKGVLINPSFEQGYKGWVITGCTKSLVTETPYLDKSLKLTCTNETFSIKQVSASLTDFKNQQGAFDLQIKTTASGVNVSSITNGVRDNSYTVISDTTFKRFKEIGFIIGDTDNGIEVYSDVNFTGEIVVDNFKVGLGNLTQEIQGAHFVGSLTYVTAGSGIFTRSSTAYGIMTSSAPYAPEVVGGISVVDNSKTSYTVNNARTDGVYKVSIQGLFYNQANIGGCLWSISKSTTGAENNPVMLAQASSREQNYIGSNIRFDTIGSQEIHLISRNGNGTECTLITNASNTTQVSVYFFPDSKSTIAVQKSQSPNYAGFLSFSFMDGDLQGHLPADGRCVAKNLYPDYDKRVANLYGDCDAGTGANSGYNLPDMRGYFPRMVDTTSEGTAGVNPDNTVIGGKQADEFQSHNHQYTWGANAGGGVVGMNQLYNFLASANNVAAQTTASRGGNETRPSAISLMAYVRMADNNLVVGTFEQIETVTGDLTDDDINTFGFVWIPSSNTFISKSDNINATVSGIGDYALTFTGLSSPPRCTFDGGNTNDNVNNPVVCGKRFGELVTNTGMNVTCKQTSRINPTALHASCHRTGSDINKSFTGAVINAADSSQLIADTIRAEIVSDDLVVVEATMSANQNIPTSTITKVVYGNEKTDNFNAYDPITGIFVAPKNGEYRIEADVLYVAFVSVSTIEMGIDVNGTDVRDRIWDTDNKAFPWQTDIGKTVTLNQGDIVHVYVWQGTGSSRTLNSAISDSRKTLKITQSATRESILENFNNANTTKCQTKFLSANVTSDANIADLSFNGLDITKKYRVNIFGRYQPSGTDTMILGVDIATTRLCAAFPSGTAGESASSFKSCIINPTSSTLTAKSVSVTGTLMGGSVNLSDRSSIELCELPDTVIETTEFN